MLQTIYNYRPITETLATAGQPTAAQFVAIHQAGFKVIVNLALPTSDNALPDERSVVEAQGMTYVSIPVMWDEPELSDFIKFQQVMTDYAGEKVFVHCAANMRVSAFVYLHRCLSGVPESTAKQSLHSIWVPNETWQIFIQGVLDQHFADASHTD